MKKYLCIVLIYDLFLATIKSIDKTVNLSTWLLALLLYYLLSVFMTEVNRGFFYPQAI